MLAGIHRRAADSSTATAAVYANDWCHQRRHSSARTIPLVERTLHARQALHQPRSDCWIGHSDLWGSASEQQEHCGIHLLFGHLSSGIAAQGDAAGNYRYSIRKFSVHSGRRPGTELCRDAHSGRDLDARAVLVPGTSAGDSGHVQRVRRFGLHSACLPRLSPSVAERGDWQPPDFTWRRGNGLLHC